MFCLGCCYDYPQSELRLITGKGLGLGLWLRLGRGCDYLRVCIRITVIAYHERLLPQLVFSPFVRYWGRKDPQVFQNILKPVPWNVWCKGCFSYLLKSSSFTYNFHLLVVKLCFVSGLHHRHITWRCIQWSGITSTPRSSSRAVLTGRLKYGITITCKLLYTRFSDSKGCCVVFGLVELHGPAWGLTLFHVLWL